MNSSPQTGSYAASRSFPTGWDQMENEMRTGFAEMYRQRSQQAQQRGPRHLDTQTPGKRRGRPPTQSQRDRLQDMPQ
jgi:hypothetical protein